MREEAEHQTVLYDCVLVELAAAFDARVALCDALAVAAQTKGVHVETVAQEAECARTDAEVFVVVDYIFVEPFVVRTAEGPRRQVLIVVAERVDDRAVLVRKLIAFGGNSALDALSRLRRDHERVGGHLTRIKASDLLHVVVDGVESLASEAEHHVDVAGRKELLGVLQAFVDLFTRAELLVAVRELQDVVVEALHTDRHAVDQTFEVAEGGSCDDLRVGFAGYFADRREKLLGVLDRFDQFFLNDGRRTAAHIHGMEVVAERLHIIHFLAQIDEILASLPLLEEEAVECAVRTERSAERNVCVKQVLVTVLRRRRILENDRIAVQVALRVVVHHSIRNADHPFGQKLARRRDVA